jgi:hypothetical protein
MIDHSHRSCKNLEEEIELVGHSLSAVGDMNLRRCHEIDTLIVVEVDRSDLQDGKCQRNGFDRTGDCYNFSKEEVQVVGEVDATSCCRSVVASCSSTFSCLCPWSSLKK